MKLAHRANPKPRSTGSPRVIDTDRLDSMLGQLADEHSGLLELAQAHRQAISHASIEELNAITNKTTDALMRIARIEDNRRKLVADENGKVSPLDELMEQFNHDDQERINDSRTRLKELILRVQEEQSAVKEATENLASHMRGLIQQVGASLSHAGTYSRGGAIAPTRAQVVSSLDVVQ